MRKFILLSLLISNLAFADNYAQRDDVQKFINDISQKQNLDKNEIKSLFQQIQQDKSVLEKISKPAEKTKPWFEYKKIFSDEQRLKTSIDFYKKNTAVLKKAYEIYGVDPAIIVAIIGVETRHGSFTGKTPTLQSLATLCFDYPPRSEFFCQELENFLLLSKKESWNYLDIHGSYAGALGMAQFMPSSYLNDAIDFDNDHKIDLWKSDSDAIGSVANYLKNRGWIKDGKYFYQVKEKFDYEDKLQPYLEKSSLEEKYPEIKNSDEELFGSLTLDSENSKLYFLTLNNFYVITKYNTSPMYAMSVVELAQKINSSINSENNN